MSIDALVCLLTSGKQAGYLAGLLVVGLPVCRATGGLTVCEPAWLASSDGQGKVWTSSHEHPYE